MTYFSKKHLNPNLYEDAELGNWGRGGRAWKWQGMKMAGHILPFSSQHFQRGNPLLGGGRGRDPGSQSKCFKKKKKEKNGGDVEPFIKVKEIFVHDRVYHWLYIRSTEQLKNDSLSVCNKGGMEGYLRREIWYNSNGGGWTMNVKVYIHVLPFLFYTALNNIQTQEFSKVFQWVLFGLVVVLSRPIFVPLCPNVFWQKTEIWHLDQWRQGVKGKKKKYNMSKNETKTINIVINNSKSIT